MENLLNAAWLVLSLVAGCLWLRRWRLVSRFSLPVQTCALGCSLIILFPVVSANDDLYLQQTAIETSEKQKSAATSFLGNLVQPSRHHIIFSFGLAQTPPKERHDVLFARLSAGPGLLRLATFSSPSFLTRPPPYRSLA
jgi:hypothetical protein